jgi:high-affinity Fe2+/Pb2+ permease
MFSKGQLIFGILFAITFIGILFYAYLKDSKLHKKYYKGSLWILLVFIGFISGIAAIKFILGY